MVVLSEQEAFTMKRRIYIFILLIFAFIFTACSEEESKEEVIQAIEENMDEVESYYTELDRNTKFTSLSDDETLDAGESKARLDIVEEPLQISGELLDNDEWAEYYITEQATLEKVEGKEWEDIEEQADTYRNLKPTYSEAAQIILDIGNEDDVVMERKDDKYIFTFTGENESIFEAFEEPYSLTLKRDMTQDIKIIVDSETYFVEHMENVLELEDILPGGIEEGKLDVFLQQTYADFNENEEITIPQDVIDEASE